MKVAFITCRSRGTCSHHLQEFSSTEVALVILVNPIKSKKAKFRKLKKIFQIGLIGAIIGVLLRKHYNISRNIPNLTDLCREKNIPMYIASGYNDPKIIALLKKETIELLVSLGNNYIPSKVYSFLLKGAINIHHEILPEYINAQSVIWSIYNNQQYTGYTIHAITKKIDEGEIIFQEKIPIQFKANLGKTIGTTYSCLLTASVQGLHKVLNEDQTTFTKTIALHSSKKYTTPSLIEFLKIYRVNRKMSSKNV